MQTIVKYFLIFVSISCLYHNIVFADESDSEPKYVINDVGDGWERADEGWPLVDPLDENVSQFYYLRNHSQSISWKINREFIDSVKELQTMFRIDFKYWSHCKSQEQEPHLVVTVDDKDDVVSAHYKQYYENNWMSCQYILSYEQLKSFVIHIESFENNAIIAFKDVQIKYQSEDKVNQNYVQKDTLFYNSDISSAEDVFDSESIQSYGMDLSDDNIDHCFDLTYFAQKSTLISVAISSDDRVNDTILTIEPNVNQREATQFCVRDLVAIKGKNYDISLNANEEHFQNGINFTKSEPKVWNFKPKAFLSAMKASTHEYDGALNGSNDWREEWTQLSPNTKNLFDFRDDLIKFYAFANSRRPASAQLISTWIKYDKNLHKISSQYTIEVNETQVFNTFKVRPKVCNELSHCFDVRQTKVTESDSETKRIIDFEFNAMNGTKYIKLMFYIQYFRPIYETKNTFSDVTFGLKLTHFGDPCFGAETTNVCHSRGQCIADPEQSVPNVPVCECDLGYLGPHCQTIDYCNTVDEIVANDRPQNTSGRKYCYLHMKRRECENLVNEKSFRCVCGEEEAFNWFNYECRPTKRTDSHWSNGTNGWLYPSDKSNEMVFEFLSVDTNRYDICVDINYRSKQNVFLSAIYGSQNDRQFTYELPNSEDSEKSWSVCVRDFTYSPKESFNLSLTIVANIPSYNETYFTLSDVKPNVKPIGRKHMDFIEGWDKHFDQNQWKVFPENNWSKKDNSTQISIQVDAYSEATALLMSDWIEFNENLKNSENKFVVEMSEKLWDYMKIDVTFRYQVKDVLNSHTNSDIDLETHNIDDQKLAKIQIPPEIQSAFKMIIEIHLKNSDNKKAQNFDVKIRGLSLGDGCAGDGMCDNTGECVSVGPNKIRCICDDTQNGDKCQYNNKCIPNFVKKCQTMPSIINSYAVDDKRCRQTSDDGFGCECDNYWSFDSKNCFRSFQYKDHKQSCESKSCQFLDSIASDTKWSNKNMPQIDADSKSADIFPFYFSTKSASELDIDLKNFDNRLDACFDIKYHENNDSDLLISYNDSKPLTLSLTTSNSDPQWSVQRICTSYLAKKFDKDLKIKIKPQFDDSSDNLIAFHVKKNQMNFIKRDQTVDELPFLVHWYERDVNNSFTFDNQWPIQVPEGEWTAVGDQLVFKPQLFGKRNSYLMSTWITKYVDGFKLRLNRSSAHFENLLLQIVVFDEKMVEKVVLDNVFGDSLMDLNAMTTVDQNNTVVITIPKMDNSFRVGLKVSYVRDSEDSEQTFSLSAIDLGDPCIQDNTLVRDCGLGGTCTSSAPVDGYQCNCRSGLTGRDCEITDWCGHKNQELGETGDTFCRTGGFGQCSNGGFGGFYCGCGKDMFWEPIGRKCLPNLKCLTNGCDPDSQRCTEPDGTCVCKEGFNKISNDTCAKYDPCSDAKCRDGSKCHPLLDNEGTLKGHRCVCPEGQSGDGSKCEPLVCKEMFDECQQSCHVTNDDKGYNCSCNDNYWWNDYKCEPKGGKKCDCAPNAYCIDADPKCQCKKGYELTEDSITCRPKHSYPVDDYICPTGRATNGTNNQLVCDCGTGFTMNFGITCDLVSICANGSTGRDDCDNRNAFCLINTANVDKADGRHQCDCPESTFMFNNTMCVGYCDYDNRSEKCHEINAECDPTTNATDVGDYCMCRPGYYWSPHDRACVVGAKVVRFGLEIKDTFENRRRVLNTFTKDSNEDKDLMKFSLNLEQIFAEINATNEENQRIDDRLNGKLWPLIVNKRILKDVKYIIGKTEFRHSKDMISIEKCDFDHNSYHCLFAMNLDDKSPKNYSSVFVQTLTDPHFCMSFEGSSDHCFFPMNPNEHRKAWQSYSGSDTKLYSIVINRSELQKTTLTLRKPCTEDETHCMGRTQCQDTGATESTLYSCVCNPDYFKTVGEAHIVYGVPMSSCEALDLCDVRCNTSAKHDPNGRCYQSEPQLNERKEWVIDYDCGCAQNYTVRNASSGCVGVCDDVDCSHGQCVPKGGSGYACDCDQGWNGDNCRTETKPSIRLWIVVTAVLSVAIACVTLLATFLCVKLKRTGSDSFNTRSLSMDDSATTFRVTRGGPPVIRINSRTINETHLKANRSQE